jgi:hypothetical protein
MSDVKDTPPKKIYDAWKSKRRLKARHDFSQSIVGKKSLRSKNISRQKILGFWAKADAIFRHPTTLLVSGFILTSIVGNRIQTKQQELEKDRAIVQEAKLGAMKITSAVASFTTRLQLAIHSATAAGTSNQQNEQKSIDDAFVTLNETVTSQIVLLERPFDLKGRTDDDVDTALWNFKTFVEGETFLTKPVSDKYHHEEQIRLFFCSRFILGPIQTALDVDAPERKKAYLEAVKTFIVKLDKSNQDRLDATGNCSDSLHDDGP